ncbi:MAG: acyl-CoA dehydrogenase [Myxococcota bacterium]
MIDRSAHEAFVPEAIRKAWDDADALVAGALAIEEAASSSAEALRELVAYFGRHNLLRHCVADTFGGHRPFSVRAVCLVRERLAIASPLVELAFAMQGLGSFPIGHAAGPDGFMHAVVEGRAVAAFALTEPGAGSDLSRLATRAMPANIETPSGRPKEGYRLNGEKVYISNAGIADGYTVFARTSDAENRFATAFFVPRDAEGLVTEPMPVLGGHPIGRLRFNNVFVPAEHRLGEEGRGLALALATLSRFRVTVGAAALGFAQRALDEALAHTKRRRQFGGPLAELPQVQAQLGEMACEVEGARLLVYRAAADLDEGAPRTVTSRTGSMAKLVATENAQRVIDRAVQLHGALGVNTESVVSRLYEEVRALRIYEGASEIQRTLIARELLRG